MDISASLIENNAGKNVDQTKSRRELTDDNNELETSNGSCDFTLCDAGSSTVATESINPHGFASNGNKSNKLKKK